MFPRPILLSISYACLVFSMFLLSDVPGGNEINKIVGFIFFIIFLFHIRGRRFVVTAEHICLLLWCGYGLFISLFARDSQVAFLKSLTIIQLAVLSVLITNSIMWFSSVRYAAYLFVMAGISSFLIMYTPLAELYHVQHSFVLMSRVAGTFRDTNMFGIVMVQVLFMAMFLFAIEKKMWLKLSLLGVAVIPCLGVYQSGSRAAVLCMAILLLIFVSWSFRVYDIKKPKRLIFFVLCVMIMIVIGFVVISENPDIVRRYTILYDVLSAGGDVAKETTGHSLKGRKWMMEFALELVYKYPFGVGLDNFSIHSPTGGFAHSNYFEILADTGIFGFLLFYACYLILFVRVFRLSSVVATVVEKRMLLCFPLVLMLLDVAMVNYYSKALWISFSIIVADVILLKEHNRICSI